MFTRSAFIGFGLIVAMGAGGAAQQGALVPADPALKFMQPWKPATVTGETRIIGTVIDIRQVPVANAKVRLRNLNTGNIEQEAITNDQGEYAFANVEPGSYVVEMVVADGDGSIIALSNAGALARYETLQTVVQLPGRWDLPSRQMVMTQNVSDFFGMSSALTITAATLTMAVEQNIRPLDAGEPVSP